MQKQLARLWPRASITTLAVIFAVSLVCGTLAAVDDDWPRWRGPNDDGMARGSLERYL